MTYQKNEYKNKTKIKTKNRIKQKASWNNIIKVQRFHKLLDPNKKFNQTIQ